MRLARIAVMLFLASIVVSTLGTSAARALGAPSPLPANWMLLDSNRCAGTGSTCIAARNFELYARNPSTGALSQITDDPAYDSWWPKLSPDRTKIMFHRTDAGLKETDWTKTSTWQVNVDGTGLVKLISSFDGLAKTPTVGPAWKFQGHAEWAPQGNAVAIIGATEAQLTAGSTQIYVLPYANNAVGTPFQATYGANNTGDRPGLNLDPSWNPDQGSLLFVGCPLNAGRTACDASAPSQQEVFLTASTFHGIEIQRTLTADGTLNFDPYYSPNGSQIAFLHANSCTRFGIRHMNADGTSLSTVIDDGAVNSKPAWTTDSSTTYFHRWPSVQPTLWKIGAGGSGLTQLDPTGACMSEEPTNTSANLTPPPPPLGWPTLPAGTIAFGSDRCSATALQCNPFQNWEIYTLDALGNVVQLTNNGSFDSFSPKISPDRTQILFYRTETGYRRDPLHYSLWVINIDGSGLTKLVGAGLGGQSPNQYGWVTQNDAAWAPQGNAITMSAATATQNAAASPQIYLVSFANGIFGPSVGPTAYQVTYGASGVGDRPGANVEPSWNPDQGSILFSGCALNANRTACNPAYSTNEVILTASTSHTLEIQRTFTTDGTRYHHPAYSPNGAVIAASRQMTCSRNDLYKLNADGTGLTAVLSDGGQNLHPQWSTDSGTLYFHRLPVDARASIWKITPNGPPLGGTALTAITTSTPCASEFPNLGP